MQLPHKYKLRPVVFSRFSSFNNIFFLHHLFLIISINFSILIDCFMFSKEFQPNNFYRPLKFLNYQLIFISKTLQIVSINFSVFTIFFCFCREWKKSPVHSMGNLQLNNEGETKIETKKWNEKIWLQSFLGLPDLCCTFSHEAFELKEPWVYKNSFQWIRYSLTDARIQSFLFFTKATEMNQSGNPKNNKLQSH